MAIFAILSQEFVPHLKLNIEQQHPGKFRHWSDQVSFVVASSTAQAVAEGIGIKTRTLEGALTQGFGDAIVIEVAPSYWGWTDATFWSWLTSAFQEGM